MKYRKNENIPTFEELESPYKDLSFEEKTGEKFERKVKRKIVDLRNGYGTTKPIKQN